MGSERAIAVRIWEGYYKCLVNIRYYQLTSDNDERNLLKRLRNLRDKYRRLKNRIDSGKKVLEQTLDKLYLENHNIEKDEVNSPDMKLLKQAQGDVNKSLYGVRTYDEVIAQQQAE